MTPALVISPQKTRGKMKWTLMNTPFAEMLYSVARTSEHLFPQHPQLGPRWSNRVCIIVNTFSNVPPSGHHLNHMRIQQGTIVSMINLHLVIGNNNTCCGVVVVAGRLMAVFSRYSNNSSTFSPLLRVLGSRKRETSESILPLPETFYPSHILILVATQMDSFVVMKLLLK